MIPQHSAAESSISAGRHESVRWLSDQLRDYLLYIEETKLRRAIRDWLRRTDDLPSGDLKDHIEDRIAQIPQRARPEESAVPASRYAMRRKEGRGDTEFPDACRGCPHYGTSCPVFTNPTEEDHRQMIQRDAEDEPVATVKRRYRQYANHNECHRIEGIIRDYEDQYADHVDEGWQLFSQADERLDIGRTTESAEVAETMEQMGLDTDGGPP